MYTSSHDRRDSDSCSTAVSDEGVDNIDVAYDSETRPGAELSACSTLTTSMPSAGAKSSWHERTTSWSTSTAGATGARCSRSIHPRDACLCGSDFVFRRRGRKGEEVRCWSADAIDGVCVRRAPDAAAVPFGTGLIISPGFCCSGVSARSCGLFDCLFSLMSGFGGLAVAVSYEPYNETGERGRREGQESMGENSSASAHGAYPQACAKPRLCITKSAGSINADTDEREGILIFSRKS
ncbi:hypothetical protein C8R45DRAFT_628276 [Mycena sanguinolenta]|nr:hypothetical protein C8R45DRAFT_628276 [Mycena sanguinolenta]